MASTQNDLIDCGALLEFPVRKWRKLRREFYRNFS
jgi:hypothetical protein